MCIYLESDDIFFNLLLEHFTLNHAVSISGINCSDARSTLIVGISRSRRLGSILRKINEEENRRSRLGFWGGVVRVLARNVTPAKFTGCRIVQPATTIYLHFYRAVYINARVCVFTCVHIHTYTHEGETQLSVARARKYFRTHSLRVVFARPCISHVRVHKYIKIKED